MEMVLREFLGALRRFSTRSSASGLLYATSAFTRSPGFFSAPACFCCCSSALRFNPDCPSQLKLWYDKVGHQLIVTVLGAKELPVRDDGRPRNPYVKIYFLPDRR